MRSAAPVTVACFLGRIGLAGCCHCGAKWRHTQGPCIAMNNGGAAIGGRPGVRPHQEITARLVGVGAPWMGGRRWINCSVAGEEQPRRACLPTRSTDSGAARAAKVLQAGNWPIGSQTGGRDKLEEEGSISPSTKYHPKNKGELAGAC